MGMMFSRVTDEESEALRRSYYLQVLLTGGSKAGLQTWVLKITFLSAKTGIVSIAAATVSLDMCACVGGWIGEGAAVPCLGMVSPRVGMGVMGGEVSGEEGLRAFIHACVQHTLSRSLLGKDTLLGTV